MLLEPDAMSGTPEELARVQIDSQLAAAGWAVQDLAVLACTIVTPGIDPTNLAAVTRITFN